MLTLRAYQLSMVRHILTHSRCAIWAGMGMGKTSATLEAIASMRLLAPCQVLVVAPLRVAAHVWPAEAAKWGHDFIVEPIIGTPKERLAALDKHADVNTVNYETLPWLASACEWRWDIVVADESTRLKSFRLGGHKGQRARALRPVAFSKVKRFIELTGTPSPNGLLDLWGQLWFMDQGERLGRTYTAFVNRWFKQPHPNAYNWVPHKHAFAEISDRTKDLCMSLSPRDWFDLREPIVVDVPVVLPAKAMKVYQALEDDLFAKVNDKSVEATSAATLSIKCLQIASGAIYTDEAGHWEPVHDAKLDALESIIEESAGASILVAYHFRSDLDRLRKRFPHGVELDKGSAIIDDWNGGRVSLLFAHPASAGHGLNLQDGGNIVVMFSHWWDLEQYQQLIERIGPVRQMQSGHDRPVYIYNIRAEGTIDGDVIARRTTKKAVQDLLLAKAKRATKSSA